MEDFVHGWRVDGGYVHMYSWGFTVFQCQGDEEKCERDQEGAAREVEEIQDSDMAWNMSNVVDASNRMRTITHWI